MKVNSHFVAQSIEVLKDLQDRPFTTQYPDIYKGCIPLIEGTDEDIENFEKVVRKLKKGARREEDLDDIGGWKRRFFDKSEGWERDFFDVLKNLQSIAYFRLKNKGRNDFREEIYKEVLPPSFENFYVLDNETETYLNPIQRYLVGVEKYFRAECNYLAALKKLDEIDVEETIKAFRKLEEEVN